jgi:hypothetical protein
MRAIASNAMCCLPAFSIITRQQVGGRQELSSERTDNPTEGCSRRRHLVRLELMAALEVRTDRLPSRIPLQREI